MQQKRRKENKEERITGIDLETKKPSTKLDLIK